MEVDNRFTTADHICENCVGQLLGICAVLVTGKTPVQVIMVTDVPAAKAISFRVDNRNCDENATECFRIDLSGYLPYNLNAVQLVSVYGGCQAEYRAGMTTVYYLD
jgi:hypothetical protein